MHLILEGETAESPGSKGRGPRGVGDGAECHGDRTGCRVQTGLRPQVLFLAVAGPSIVALRHRRCQGRACHLAVTRLRDDIEGEGQGDLEPHPARSAHAGDHEEHGVWGKQGAPSLKYPRLLVHPPPHRTSSYQRRIRSCQSVKTPGLSRQGGN